MLSQHFKALRDAGLIRFRLRGVEMHNVSRCEELDKRFSGLVAAIINAHKAQIAAKERAGTGKAKRAAGSARARW